MSAMDVMDAIDSGAYDVPITVLIGVLLMALFIPWLEGGAK